MRLDDNRGRDAIARAFALPYSLHRVVLHREVTMPPSMATVNLSIVNYSQIEGRVLPSTEALNDSAAPRRAPQRSYPTLGFF